MQVPCPDGGPPSQVIHVQPGQTLSFGRGGPDLDVDIRLADQGVSRLAGELTAAEDYWLITNLSAEASYVVDNPEGGGEYLTLAPRRIAAPVPFEFARVSLPTRERPAEFLVFAPQHGYAEPGASLGGDRTVAAFSLDETARYFLILVALCEPRLRDSAIGRPADGRRDRRAPARTPRADPRRRQSPHRLPGDREAAGEGARARPAGRQARGARRDRAAVRDRARRAPAPAAAEGSVNARRRRRPARLPRRRMARSRAHRLGCVGQRLRRARRGRDRGGAEVHRRRPALAVPVRAARGSAVQRAGRPSRARADPRDVRRRGTVAGRASTALSSSRWSAASATSRMPSATSIPCP